MTTVQPSEIDISQKKLIGQCIVYINFEKKRNHQSSLSLFRNITLRLGWCGGFSVVFAYMGVIDKLGWWFALLKEVSKWDRNPASLNKIISLPDERSGKPNSEKTLDYYFKQLIHFTLFHQFSLQHGIPHLKAYCYFREFFDSAEGKVLDYCGSGSYQRKCTYEEFDRHLMSPAFFFSPTKLCLLSAHIAGPFYHACSLRFERETKQWLLYDSNTPTGVACFSNTAALYYAFVKRYSDKVVFECASFNYPLNIFVRDRTEKLTALRQQVSYLQEYYFDKKSTGKVSGFDAGLFGRCFSTDAKLQATSRLLIKINEALAGDCAFSENDFTPAEKNGKLKDVFLELMELNTVAVKSGYRCA